MILVLFTVPFCHFLFSRYLGLAKRHFSSDILVPFPNLSDLYSRELWIKTINFFPVRKLTDMHLTHSLNILKHLTHYQARDLGREICFHFCFVFIFSIYIPTLGAGNAQKSTVASMVIFLKLKTQE